MTHHESVRFADLSYSFPVSSQACRNDDIVRAHDLRKVALRYRQFKRNRFSYRMISEIESKKEQRRETVAHFLAVLAPWQTLIEAIEYRHGVIVGSVVELHRWFFVINGLLFLPILIFVIIPQATVPANPVAPSLIEYDGFLLNRSANNFSCRSFRTCFVESWFFIAPYQPTLSVALDGFQFYNMQLAYLLSLAAFFLVGLGAASGIVFGIQPFSGHLETMPLFAWVFNAWNHEISNSSLREVTTSLVTHRLKEHLRLTIRRSNSITEDDGRCRWLTRRVFGVIFFELLFGLLFAATLVAVFYFYDLAAYSGVDGVVVETVGPLLATALPTFFLLSADLTAAGILTGGNEKRLALYQPWHLFFRAVLFRISAIIVVAYRWTFCFPNKQGLLLEPPPSTTVASLKFDEDADNDDEPVSTAVYAFKYASRQHPPFCPSAKDDTGWELLVGRQVVLLSLYTAGFFLIESLLIFAVAQARKARQTKLLSARKKTLLTFPASRYAAYAVTLDLLSLVGAYFFPLSPGLTAVLLLITFYSMTSLVNPRFSDTPVAFSWNNRRPGMLGNSDDEHVFQATVAVRFLRLFPYIFSGLFFMYVFYSIPVSPNLGPLRSSLNTTSIGEFRPAIWAIRGALITPLIRIPVIGWVVRLLDQPPFAYLIALSIVVTATFAIARIVAVKRRLDFVAKQLVLAREDTNFLFEELQKAKRRTLASW